MNPPDWRVFYSGFIVCEIICILAYMELHPRVSKSSRLHNYLLFEDPPTTVVTTHKRIGRSLEKIAERNTYLIYRMYFKTKIERKLYPTVLNELATEVYLSEIQVQKILWANADNIIRLKTQKPSVAALKKLYPHIVW